MAPTSTTAADRNALIAWGILAAVFLGTELRLPLSRLLRRLPRPVLAAGLGSLSFWLFEHLVVDR